MATKIRYSVHTTNKYSVFDSDNSEEEIKNKNLKESSKSDNNIIYEKINDNNNEDKKTNEIKIIDSQVIKENKNKKVLNQYNDRYKYPFSSLNDVNEASYRNYRDNFHLRGNIRNKFSRKRGVGYNNNPSNPIGGSHFFRGSRNYDYKMNDRRNYNNVYSYNKLDFKEKFFNDYNDSSSKYDNLKRENLSDLKNKNFDESMKTYRKHESVTIDYDLYRRQQEKKLNSNKNTESADKKKKKNEINNEKSSDKNNERSNEKNIEKNYEKSDEKNNEKSYERINKISNNTRRNDIDEENKSEHPKRKAINVYQYILDKGGRVDRIPGFRRNYRNFRKGDEDNWNNKNDKTKTSIDEKDFKKRDPPNINDTRAFPSLTSK